MWDVHCLQALGNDAYDHYTAIYYLLLDRLRQHRSSFPSDTRIDARRRRPSTIAEQAMLHMLPSQVRVCGVGLVGSWWGGKVGILVLPRLVLLLKTCLEKLGWWAADWGRGGGWYSHSSTIGASSESLFRK